MSYGLWRRKNELVYHQFKFFPARWIMVFAMSLGGCSFMRSIVFIDGQNLYHLARRAWATAPPFLRKQESIPGHCRSRVTVQS